MKRLLIALACWLAALGMNAASVTSPNGNIELKFSIDQTGRPVYAVTYKGRDIILPSHLGLELAKDKHASKGLKETDLMDGFTLKSEQTSTFDETWQPVWGENRDIRNHYTEYVAVLQQQAEQREMAIRFRVYDDGIGFRYEFPQQKELNYFLIQDERSEFRMTGDHTAWWLPGDYDSQEYNYKECRLSEINRYCEEMRIPNASQEGFSPWGVQTAIQMKTDEGLYLNIHEAAVLDYPAANLLYDPVHQVFQIHLTPDAQGVKGRLQAPCKTPWRSVMVCQSATDVLASRLILNLNDPCAIEDVSWIHPVKYVGVWWEMITGKTKSFFLPNQSSQPSFHPSTRTASKPFSAAKSI